MIDDVVAESDKDLNKKTAHHPRPDKLDLFSNGKSTKQHENEKTKSPAVITELNFNLHSRPTEKTALEICGEQMEKMC